MTITQTGGVDVFEPESDAEVTSFQPSSNSGFQFLKLSRQEYMIYHGGQLLGSATRLPHEEAWQAVNKHQGWCVAPLWSLIDCANRLLSRHLSPM